MMVIFMVCLLRGSIIAISRAAFQPSRFRGRHSLMAGQHGAAPQWIMAGPALINEAGGISVLAGALAPHTT
jgi:hypothetical protein